VIDHTLLKPDATRDQVENSATKRSATFCLRHGESGLGADSRRVLTERASLWGGHRLSVGASLVSTLRHEAAALLRLGARELDMVIPLAC